MADLPSLLAVIEHDPDDSQALDALSQAARSAPSDLRATRLAASRKTLAAKGRPDAVVALLDVELAATPEGGRKADLLLEKGMVLDGELLDVTGARTAFQEVLELRQGDPMATEALADLVLAEQNWKKFADKFLHEATASTDRTLATALYVSAAECFVRFQPDAIDAEAHLRKALDVDPKNGKAAFHLVRMLRRGRRWDELGKLLADRAERAGSTDEKVAALIWLYELSSGPLGDPPHAEQSIRRVLGLDPSHPRALRIVTDSAAAANDWPAVVAAYQAALKVRRDGGEDLGMLLQVAMVLWKRIGDLDGAETYFQRIRKLDSGHPAALDFYRAFYTAKGDSTKLMSMLRQAEKGGRPRSDSGEKSLSIEIAELAEQQNNPEKAIEAWKQHLRQDPTSVKARAALARLYRRTEKWNALLDLMKDEIDKLPEGDIEGRVSRLFDVSEIYRDRLRLDVMVINTYNAILKLDPENTRATDDLAGKYRALGRWNDLIAILTKKSEAPNVPDGERVKLLREVADLWSERFGNFANAIKPLERIVELAPTDTETVNRLKEIYTKRRQWRQLIDLIGKEAAALPTEERRSKRMEMARLAAERQGDTRLAIEIYNTLLAEAPDHPETLVALANLYEREKRYLAYAEILHRQRKALKGKEAIALLEKLGQVYSDRLGAPQQAAAAWKDVLDIEPNHAKALRTLRELYAMAGDFAGLEQLYARLGQEGELIEALLAIADRLDAKAARLPLVQRAAELAQKNADAASGAPAPLEKARQVWERVLAVEPLHVGAAAALAPIYIKQEKWARVLSVMEIELTAVKEPAERIAKIGAIRKLCEDKLSSKTLAFQWAVRAFDLEPTSSALYGDITRLANEPDQWRELAAALDRALTKELPAPLRLEFNRQLAKLATRRLGDLERARGYHRQVIALQGDDKDAESQLEELATQLADWQELLASQRRRAAREQNASTKATLLMEIAALQEQKLMDLEGAATTYREVLATVPGHARALRALGRIEEARGDWESLSEVLSQELAQTADGQPRFDLLMRLGALEDQSLDRPQQALGYYRDALGVVAVGGGVRPQAVEAVARIVLAPTTAARLDAKERVAATRQVLPHLERAKQTAQQAAALEVIRASDDANAHEKVEIDRQLMRLYHVDLGDPGAAWTAGLRVMSADPADIDVRGSLAALAGQLGRDGEWAKQLSAGLAQLQQKDATPGEIRTIATELAHIAGDRLGDHATAERAWITVLEVDSQAAEAFDALGDAYRSEQRWGDLRALLERRAEVALDPHIKLVSLLQLAKIEEEMLGDPTRATDAYRRALDIDAGNADAHAALDRVYTESKQWADLEALLAKRADHVDSAPQQVELAFRRATLWARELSNPSRAVDLLEDVLSKHRHHEDGRELAEELLTDPKAGAVQLRIARMLEPLYEEDRLWKDLASVLRVQRSLVEGTEAVELLARLAALEETENGNARGAFDAWLEVLRQEPSHERARVELARLAQWLQRWPEVTAAFETAVNALPETDSATRAALLGELASYYDMQVGDAPHAITAYRRLLEADPTSPSTIRRAGASLARLYEEQQSWPDLRAIVRRQAEWAEDAGERRTLLARVAQLEEEKLGDKDAAIASWRDVLQDQPADAGALHALERLFQAAGQWRELIDILRRKIDIASDQEDIVLLSRVAEIHELKLSETDEAIAAWLEVLDRDGEHGRALSELARLYGSAERHADLLDVRERQAQLAHGGEQLALHVEIAKLLSGPLSRPVEALDRWAFILRAEPEHEAALAAVEASLGDLDLRVQAADILRPVYAASAQDARLAELSLRQSEWTDDQTTKLRALGEVVHLREKRLGDKAGAFEAQLLALRHAPGSLQMGEIVAETERLAGELGREADLIDAYRAVAPDVYDAEIQRRLYLDIADLSRAVRRDLELARQYYEKVLESQPEDRRALAALESIYRETNDDLHLTEILLRQAEVAGADVEDRVGALVESAGLYVQLRRPDDAITTWEQVLAIAPERGDAIYALEGLYSQQGRWHDVVDLYERRLGFVTSMEEAVALRVQLGQVHEKQLRDVEAAIENYAAALGGNLKQEAALAALERLLLDPDARAQAAEVLEPIYVGQHRWHDLIRVHEAKLESAADPEERLRITRFVARLHEEQLEDFESASKWYAKVFREAPGDDGVRDQLQRLASIVGNWGFVAETYQAFLDSESGETPELREVAIAAAMIYDRRLNDIDKAYAAYRRAAAIDVEEEVFPDTRELVRRLEELCSRTQRWNDLLAIYDDVIARGDDHLRRESLVKRARLLEDGIGDTARAVDAWREVVLVVEDGGSPVIESTYREAVGELERLYRSGGKWTELVDLLEARYARSTDPREGAELRLRLADVLETQTGDLRAALDQYEEIIKAGTLWERAVSALERLIVHDEHRERIIELLEPVYRDQDWWQKLVVILDAKLEYIQDPPTQVTTLHEIAELHEERGGAIDLALAALARAWRIDVSDDAALTKLLSLAGKLEAWNEAVLTVEEGAASADNTELAAGLWARAAEIHEAQRSDTRRAIDAWRKVDEARPDDLVALAALDRLLAIEGRVQELVKVVERRADLTEDAGVRLVLLHRVASMYEEILDDKPKAIGAYRNVLGVDDTDLAALDALERLYRDTGDAREMAATLERKIELTTDVPLRQQMRHSAAQVYEHHLDDVYRAIDHLTAILHDDASEQAALAELDRVYARQKMWADLLEVVDKRALLATDTKDRADLAYRAARLVEVELSEPDAAIPRYGAVLQVLASHEGARASLEQLMAKDDHVEAVTPILERVYKADREAPGLIRVYERRLAVDGRDSVSRRTDWQALAEVRENIANQPAQAFVVWGRALADSPEDLDLLVPLMRLAESQNLWRDLATLLDERLSDAAQPLSPDVEQTYAMRLGQIAEDRLSDLDRAARAYDKASSGPEVRPALAALERVLARANRWAELAACLRRQAESAEGDAAAADYRFREGDLQETQLNAPAAAVAAYREVLTLVPAHVQARSSLERLLQTATDERADIVEILEPLFEQDNDAPRLVNVLEAKLGVTPDPLDRATVLGRLVELYEQKLSDRARALDAALRWLTLDPASDQALSESERLSDRLGQWRETAARIDDIVHSKDAADRSPDVQIGLLVFLGGILRQRLGHNDDAITIYRQALALQPDALEALDPLIDLLRVKGDWNALAEALRQRGKTVQEVPEKRAAFAEVAQLCERAGDLPGAIAAWREVTDHDDSDRGALDQLARLYRTTGDRSSLVDSLSRAARLASSPADEKPLRVEIAQLESDSPRGVAAWQAVVDLDPDDASALAQLEAAHARANDWIAVSDIQMRRLDLAKTKQEKVAIHAEMAALAEKRRGSADDAISAWYAALEVDSSYLPAFAELERLLAASGRGHDLVELLEKLAELHATLGDGAAEIQALARAADVWEGQLDNPDAAGEILEKILRREPGSVAALTRLSKIYERSGDWDKCKATLEQALRLSPQGRDAADLFYRLGEVARVGDRDDATAIQHFQQVLRHDPTHAPAIAALEKLARDRRDNVLLADMLNRRVATINGADRINLLVEIADLEKKAGRNDAALAALSQAQKDVPNDVRVLAPLADLYFAAGRLDEAAPIYDTLAADAKTQRRMKDVSRFRQRQGGILEARGDRAGALTAYEEALRVNPTDVVTMTGLGRLYFSAGDWEKARKIYQSLVLQNIDSDAGVTKGEVYWALGKIHIELGQSPKAKSMFQRGLEIEPQNQKLKDALSQL
jgi:tetratricopeptide (TPR) repeat protein